MSKANDRQPGGDHYKKHGDLQPWDVIVAWNLDFFQGNILKYIARWKDKNGIEDLEKAMHYLEKYIEVEKEKRAPLLEKLNAPKQYDPNVASIEEVVESLKEEFNKHKSLDASGDNRKGLVEVDGIKFDPQRNYEMIGGEGVYVPSETVERSKEILDTLNSRDKTRFPYDGVPMGVATSFTVDTSPKFPSALTEAQVASVMEGVEPLDKLEDRLIYEPMSKELGVSIEEARKLEQDAKEVISRYPIDPLAADIAKDLSKELSDDDNGK